jgi:serine protease Do
MMGLTLQAGRGGTVLRLKRRRSFGCNGPRGPLPSGFVYSIAAWFALGTTCTNAAVDPAVLEAESQRVAVVAKVKDSVLSILAPSGGGGGSGVVISPDGYALTNFHVAKPCGNAMKCGMADGRLYDAVIVGIDPVGDLALIKLFGRSDFPSAEMGDSDRVQVGDACFALGNPFLLATDFQPTLTHGIISGVHRYQHPSGTLLEYADCLQTDASINPGNSGGPLFDAQGRLIGINGRASFEKRGRVNVGLAYAISINQVKNFLGGLKGGRIMDHATLGATVGADPEGRVLVTDILDTSDAYRRGLRYGDEVVRFAGRVIDSPNAFKNILGILPKGWRVPLTFRRDGTNREILVRLAGVHSEEELLSKITASGQALPMPVPKPNEKPTPRPGGKPPSRGKDQSPPPLPLDDEPPHALPETVPIPEIVQKHFEERRGYANYYFNRLERDRVLKAWAAVSDFRSASGPWTIAGPLESGGRYRFEISDNQIVLKLPGGETRWTASDELAGSLLPDGSGGLFATLYLWRRLATAGPDRFGDVSYLGTMPFPGRNDWVDAVMGIHAGVECRFSFDPHTGLLVALEMFPEENSDPCEVRLFDYQPLNGRQLPRRMEVWFGDERFASFSIDQFGFEKSMEP